MAVLTWDGGSRGATDFSGTVSVGAAEAITSLTNDGGLFQMMNAGTVSGNVVVNLTSDLTGETGTHSLNQLNEVGAGNYTIWFQASGGQRLITGSNANALINLTGADRVTFSGLAFGPFGLTIRNTGAGATIRFANDSSNNSILNCIVEGGTTNIGSAVILVDQGLPAGSGNDNISISNSRVRDRSDGPGVPANLVLVSSLTGAQRNSGLSIADTELFNFLNTAIYNNNGEFSNISRNTIYQTTVRNSGIFAILLAGNAGTNTISRNVIRDQATDQLFVGIYLLNNSGVANVERNRVFNVEHTGGSNVFAAMQIAGLDPNASIIATNNMFSIVPTTPTLLTAYGVLDGRLAGGLTFHHNSVHVGGTSAGNNSWAYFRESGANSSVSLVNNIFFNSRTGSNHFAIGDHSSRGGSWSSNFNLYIGNGVDPELFFDLDGTAMTFDSWKSAPPAQDVSSIASLSGVGPFNVSNMFFSGNDLHLNANGNNPAINAGTNAGITVDIDGHLRPFNGVPDVGADEVQSEPTAGEVSLSGRIATAEGRGIRNVMVTISGGSLAVPRSALTNAFGYFSFQGLEAGETYLVSVSSKRFVFDVPAIVVSPGEDAVGIDFVGMPR
ncbi:MAG: carboxypeptidase regulatory-like domain-containing protein [Chloracidobacterium sp.]|nr:carboxypeptidase regulatory-like domain-containing protein [Chloracidobacterium sp.]